MSNVISNAVVVTRHPSLVEYLLRQGVIREGEYTLHEHATPDTVKQKHVIGVLPHSLSCLTLSFTEVSMHIPAEKRGVELTIDDMHQYAGEINTYVVAKQIRKDAEPEGCIYCKSTDCIAYKYGESVCGPDYSTGE